MNKNGLEIVKTVMVMTTLCCAADLRAAVKISERFGYDPKDSTEYVQAALDSGLPRIMLDRKEGAWFVRPLKGSSNQEIIFEDGAELCAVRGEYRSTGSTLLTFSWCTNVIIRGRGIMRMWKCDYQKPPYQKSEWRHALALRSSVNVRIEDLRIESSGGDGLYLGEVIGTKVPNRDIVVKNVVFDDHHRQGVSVITASNLLIEGCTMKNTKGTPPEDGIDFEPNFPQHLLENCVVRDCLFENNAGRGAEVVLYQYDATAKPVSIRFENCRSVGDICGFNYYGALKDILKPVNDGRIDVVNCVFERSVGPAVSIARKPFSSGIVSFENCVFDGCNVKKPGRPDVSIFVSGHETYAPDTVSFSNVTIRQQRKRDWLSRQPGVVFRGEPTRICGEVRICGPDGETRTERLDEAWRRANFPRVPGCEIVTFPSVPFDPTGAEIHDLKQGEPVRLSSIPVRGKMSYVFYAPKAGPVRVTAIQRLIGSRKACRSPLRLLRHGSGRVLAEMPMPNPGKAVALPIEVPGPGFYRLEVTSTGGNSFSLVESDVPIAVDTSKNYVPLVYAEGVMWVFLPEGRRFGTEGMGVSPENFSAEVTDPSGRSVFKAGSMPEPLHYASPEGGQSGLWGIGIGKPVCGVLEDMKLRVTGVQGILFLSKEKYWSCK